MKPSKRVIATCNLGLKMVKCRLKYFRKPTNKFSPKKLVTMKKLLSIHIEFFFICRVVFVSHGFRGMLRPNT